MSPHLCGCDCRTPSLAIHARDPPWANGGTLRPTTSRWAAAHADNQLVRYNPGQTTVGGEATVVPVADVNGLAALVTSLEGEVGGLEHFTLGSDVARRLRLYIVSALTTDGSWVHGMRTKTVRSLRPTRTRRIAALWTGEMYDDLTEDPLVFDETFDAFVVGDLVVVLNQRNFERGSGFLGAARDDAEAVLRTATDRLPVANLDDLIVATRSDVNMLAKMRGIAARLTATPTTPQGSRCPTCLPSCAPIQTSTWTSAVRPERNTYRGRVREPSPTYRGHDVHHEPGPHRHVPIPKVTLGSRRLVGTWDLPPVNLLTRDFD